MTAGEKAMVQNEKNTKHMNKTIQNHYKYTKRRQLNKSSKIQYKI